MISSMVAGWGLVKETIDFSCYRKDQEKAAAEDEALVDSIFALMEEEGENSSNGKGNRRVAGGRHPAISGVPAILPGQRLD